MTEIANISYCSFICSSRSVMSDYLRPHDLSMEFSRQEYWSGLLFPSPGDLANPGMEAVSPAWEAGSLPLGQQGSWFKEWPPGKFSSNLESISNGFRIWTRTVLRVDSCAVILARWAGPARAEALGRLQTDPPWGGSSPERLVWISHPLLSPSVEGCELVRKKSPKLQGSRGCPYWPQA